MHYTRIYSDENGDTHFKIVDIPLTEKGEVGRLSDLISVRNLQFRENDPDYHWDFHNAPSRQFIILLDGEIVIETSPGEKRIFKGGDILLVEDTHGKGHRTKNITNQIRKSIFIQL